MTTTEEYLKMMEDNPTGASISAETKKNPYLQMMEDFEDQHQAQFRSSVTVGSDSNPDEVARKKRVATIIGAPLSAVEGDPETASRLSAIKTLEKDTKDAPALREKYTEIDFTKLAHDQSAGLGLVERTARNFAAGFGGDFVGSGIRGMGQTLYALEHLTGSKSLLAETLTKVGETTKKYWQDLAPTDQGFSDQVVRGVGQMAGQLPLFAVAPSVGVGMMFGQGADQMAEKIERDKAAQRADQTAQDLEILSGGVITAVTEWAASKLLLSPPQLLALKNKLLGYSAKVALGGAEEGIQEALENIGQDLSHIALTNSDSKLAWGEAIESGGVGAIVGVIASSVINGALHIRVRGSQRILQDLSDASKAQQLRERDPETYQGFADAVASHLANTSDGAVENVYVDANVFAQALAAQNIDPNEVAKIIPSIGEQFDEAKATGGDIVVPLNDYIGKMAGTNVGDILAPHLRSMPDSPSMMELDAAAKIAPDMQAKADEIISKQEQRSEFIKSANEVQKIIYDQINTAGVYTPAAARSYASFIRDFYVTQAGNFGVSPMEMYQAYPYKIQAGEINADQATQVARASYPFEKPYAKEAELVRGLRELRAQDPTAGASPTFKNKNIILTHWSKSPNLEVAEPRYHGTNHRGAEFGKSVPGRGSTQFYIPMTYFGLNKYEKEIMVGPHRYGAVVNGNDMYDMDTDPLNLFPKGIDMLNTYGVTGNAAQMELFRYRIAHAGFKGAISEGSHKATLFAPSRVAPVKPGNKSLSQKTDPSSFYQAIPNEAIKRLKEIALANPEGFTLRVSDGSKQTTGFAVAPSKLTEIRLDALTEEALSDYLNTFEEVFNNDPRAFFGGWFDSRTGKFVLDISFVVDNLEDALYIAELGDQDAIFHLDNFKEIRTDEGLAGLKENGVYSESRRDELRGVQESLHRAMQAGRAIEGAPGTDRILGRTEEEGHPGERTGAERLGAEKPGIYGRTSEKSESYPEAATKEGNPWIKQSDSPDNKGRTLLVQFTTKLMGSGVDTASEYYDLLYSGTREGYARLQDFWEIPQWIGQIAHTIPDTDVYIVRDMEAAKEFVANSGYDHIAFSSLDVTIPLIKELAPSFPGTVTIGGYANKAAFEGLNHKWYDSIEAMAKDYGHSYTQGTDYRHFKGAQVIPRLTMSQGCKYRCAFCSVPKKLDVASREFIDQQIESFKSLDARLIYLNDKTFGQANNYQYLSELNIRMKQMNPNFKGFIIQTTAADLNKMSTEWLKKSGIKYVELGIESYNDFILKGLHKPHTEKIIDSASQKLRDLKINLIPNIIIGLPEETADTYARTLDYVERNRDIISHANIYNLALYEGTELGNKIEAKNASDADENVRVKSFHTDESIHEIFANRLFQMMEERLQEPLTSDMLNQSAWHGSPHTFNKFSTSKIGTGEGAQAYGYGLYFAGKKEVAEHYQKMLAPAPKLKRWTVGSLDLYSQNRGYTDYSPKDRSADAMSRAILSENLLAEESVIIDAWLKDGEAGAKKEILRIIKETEEYFNEELTDHIPALNRLKKSVEQGRFKFDVNKEKGRLYKVELAPEEDEYLLWDKPLSEQSEKVQDAILDDLTQQINNAPYKLASEMARDSFKDEYLSKSASDYYKELGRKLAPDPGTIGPWSGGDKAASDYLHSLGIRGIKYLDGTSRSKGEGDYNYVIFSDDDVAITEMYQKMAGAKRGGFNPTTLTNILTTNADYSTFLHESAHFFLTTYAQMASDPNAPVRVKEDMQTLLDWFGVPDLATWNNMPLEEQRKHHEAFAYNYENYIFEGKAPNVKMQSVFERFSSWLKRIYVSIRDELNAIYKQEHGVDLPILTGEVKQVMDRMLASDDQIEQAEKIRGMAPIFQTQEEAQMTDEEWAAYQDMQQEAHEEAAAKHRAASLREMKWLSNMKGRMLKALQDSAKETRKGIAIEATEEINSLPIYKAQAALKGANEIEAMAIADSLGYSSVADLKSAISNAPKRADAIKARTDQRMLEEYGELVNPKSLERAVNEAIHNQARARFIGVELRHLAKTQRPVRVMQEAAKQAARAILGKRMIKDISARSYVAAEARAAAVAEDAMRKGDFATAAQQKEYQLLQNQLASEAIKANGEVAKALANFKKVFTSDKRIGKTRDMNYVNAARAILAHYGFGTSEEPATAYLAKIKAYDPDFYAEIEGMITAHQLQAKPINELTLDDFADLSDQISALWHISKRNKQIEIDGQLMDRKAIVEELNAATRDIGNTRRPGYDKAVTKWQDTKIKLMGMKAAMRRVEAWVDEMDKGNPNGPFRRYIWNPISDAVTKYRMAKVDYMAKYLEMLKGVETLLKSGPVPAPEIGYTFNTENNQSELLHAILHTGNESNKRKLLLGRGWAELKEDGKTLDTTKWDAFIARAQREGILTKAHYDFAQKLWDLLEALKPGAQKAHRQMYGFYFNEISATPFETPFGVYAGGYVPAVTDPRIVTESAMRNEQETTATDNSYMFPTTGRGFTKGRVEYNKPLLLNLGYMAAHIDKVLRFSIIEPHIKDVARIVKTNKSFAEAMDNLDQAVRADMLVPWLQRSAMQMSAIPSKGAGGKAMDAMASWLRVNTGMQIMVGNITNTLQQFIGLSISALKVKPTQLRNALWLYVRHPKDTAQRAVEKSDYMKTRMTSVQYEVQQAVDELLLNPSKYERLQDFANTHGYFMQQATQGVVDIITWVGAYNQAVEENLDEKEAVRRADSAVRMTQGSFAPEDVSRIETGSPFVRLFSQFYSYFNMQANILGTEFANTARRLGVKDGAGKMLYIYTFGFMIPAVLSDLIVQAMSGIDVGDDDEFDLTDALALFFSAQGRTAAAMIPGVGQAVVAGARTWNNRMNDDRISASPAVTAIEGLVRAPHSVYKAIADDGSWSRASKDFLTGLGMITKIPLGQLGKPVGYLMDVQQGKAQPESGLDYARGLVGGKDVNRKQ